MTTYPTYLSLADTQIYLGATPRAAAFLAEVADTQERWMVEATRMLNRQVWAGTPTEIYPADQDLAWPRDGVTGVTDGTTPQAILDAFCELTLALYLDASTLATATAGNNVKRVDSGKGVGVEFFGPSTRGAGRFPRIVQELVGAYLASRSGSGLAARASGTNETSQFTDCRDFDLTKGE